MPLLTRKSVLLAKVESTIGSDASPAVAGDEVKAFEVEINQEIDALTRDDVGVTLSPLAECGGKRRATVTFSTELKGSGTAGTPPDDDPLWQACGLLATNVPATSDTYDFVSASMKTITIYVYKDGLRHKMFGCVGNFEINATAGELIKVSWEFSGVYDTPADAAIVTPTYQSTKPIVAKNLTVTYDGYSAVVDSFTIKSNNTITERPDLNATQGIASFLITARNPEGSITPEATLLATNNFFTKFEADTTQAFSATVGSGAGEVITITAGQCRTRQITYQDRDGIVAHEIPFQLARNSADDELSIAYT